METKYLDLFYLELSQFTSATTKKEIDLAKDLDTWKTKAEGLMGLFESMNCDWNKPCMCFVCQMKQKAKEILEVK